MLQFLRLPYIVHGSLLQQCFSLYYAKEKIQCRYTCMFSACCISLSCISLSLLLSTCFVDFMWLEIVLLFTQRVSRHALQNSLPTSDTTSSSLGNSLTLCEGLIFSSFAPTRPMIVSSPKGGSSALFSFVLSQMPEALSVYPEATRFSIVQAVSPPRYLLHVIVRNVTLRIASGFSGTR